MRTTHKASPACNNGASQRRQSTAQVMAHRYKSQRREGPRKQPLRSVITIVQIWQCSFRQRWRGVRRRRCRRMPGTAPRTVCGQSPPERGEHFSNGCTPMRVAKMGAARAHAPALPDLTLLPTAPPPYCRHISVHSRGSGDAIAEGFVMAGGRTAPRLAAWVVVGLVLGIVPTGIALAKRSTRLLLLCSSPEATA
jgi:hypothetical protein